MWKSASSAQTREIARRLGEIVSAGTVLALDGELGAGKTVFAQGVALGLGVEEQVTSPSFVLMHIYQGRLLFYHFDFYRLDEEAELDSLGLEEYFDGESVVLVEWAGKFSDALPPTRLEITIVLDETGDEDARLLCVNPRGDLMSVILEEWSRRCCF
ncbi:MAG TPA: tRNA (adenosine(37)-N6)-threonylcarbamoyltransferase complex ATPase subunit type 1 TsaE [Firmicutes bacterium]|nr:tRNA (adenosine(37)-N6)-threonylcarbamoyltransferase complex ATPase subunit type 1 TsaE [Bacillota bacterium]